MSELSVKHDKLLKLAELSLGEISTLAETGDKDEVEACVEKVTGLVKQLESSVEKTKQAMLDGDLSLEDIMSWSNTQMAKLKHFRGVRSQFKEALVDKQRDEDERKFRRELEKQRAIHEEAMRVRVQEQKELDAIAEQKIQREQEWLARKIQMEKEAQEQMHEARSGASTTTTQSVKLQKYTITPFEGDYKDWIRFWNQFSVEVDGATISEISKFNYLLELTKGKPREDILGLPHTEEGYKEAKRILQSIYGKDIKVQRALIKELENLPVITSVRKTADIHEFYNKLSRVVRTLTTMGKLDSCQSMVYSLLDKLGPVREILAQTDDKWEEWKLEELTENLRKYIERNPLGEEVTKLDRQDGKGDKRRDKLLFGNNQQSGRSKCVYCDDTNHKASNCTKVLRVSDRREILRKNKLCYNCTGKGHGASKCRSRNCGKCGQKHHTSLCERQESTLGDQNKEQASLSQKQGTEKNLSGPSMYSKTLHPTLKAKVGGQDVRIMIDTGASSSYVCSDLITKLSLKPKRREKRCIEQMYGTVTKCVDIFDIRINSTAVVGFTLDVECINAEKATLTLLQNPNAKKLKGNFRRLRRLPLSDEDDSSDQLPVHIILGAADYQRIKTTENPVLGTNPDQDPGAEYTMLGWMLCGQIPSQEIPVDKGFFLSSRETEFERLCSLDVLGLVDKQHTESDLQFHEDFSEHLKQTEEGSYTTRLPWTIDHPDLPDNRDLAEARLRSTTKRLEKIGKLEEYDQIMQEQIETGILEPVPLTPTGENVHYIPHQPVIKEDSETTKLRIVYDCSAKKDPEQPSLNDCLETGPVLQPLMFDIFLRNRMRRYCVMGDIEKAFLQIWVDEEDRDAQRTLWYNNLTDRQVTEYRFTRVIFGAAPSPYILGSTLQKHVKKFEGEYPETAKALLEDTYVDDVQSGGDSVEELQKFKDEAKTIMDKGGFKLHKWHSNVEAAEDKTNLPAADQDGLTTTESEKNTKTTKILGIPWQKDDDTLQVNLERCLYPAIPLTKRKILAIVNGVFDVLGFASPVMIIGKIIFSEICFQKLSWDDQVPVDIQRRWNLWIRGINSCQNITVPRRVVEQRDAKLTLHGFSDASKKAVCAAVYVVGTYSDGRTSQNLLVSKARVAPKDMSIPRLELVAAHTLVKLVSNVITALRSWEIGETVLWTDSTTVLHWLESKGTWSTFVRNRVKVIKELSNATWRYVPTGQNPSDLGTRGVSPEHLGEFWLKGPKWMCNRDQWPQQPEVVPAKEALAEAVPKQAEKLLLQNSEGELEKKQEWAFRLVKKFKYWKLLRITAFILRFRKNCSQKEKTFGPLQTEEIEAAEICWLKIAQQEELRCPFQLKKDDSGLLRCHGRVLDYSPIFIPREHALAKSIIEHCHRATLHGGVQATMSKVRERFWIPRLRRMVKSVRASCNNCRKTMVKPLNSPPTSSQPKFRTKLTQPFSTTGVDFAGPIYHKVGKKKVAKTYIALFTCASTRAVHLKLCKDLSATEFKRALREFVARRGAPKLIVSDNAKTFIATKKWLELLKKDESVNNYLASQSIKWRFNLSRAPWWGGFFERLIGIMKSALSKAIGKALLTFQELEDVLLDVECFMNNRPLAYLGEEYEDRAVTPNILLRGEPACFLEENTEVLGDELNMTKRLRYLKQCREHLRKRWINEYLHALDEKQKSEERRTETKLKVGRVVLIKDSLKRKAQWRIGRIEEEIVGRDGIIRGYKVRTPNGYLLERPVQLIADLEVGGEKEKATEENNKSKLNPSVPEFRPQRPTRRAKETAKNRLVGLGLNEQEEDELY